MFFGFQATSSCRVGANFKFVHTPLLLWSLLSLVVFQLTVLVVPSAGCRSRPQGQTPRSPTINNCADTCSAAFRCFHYRCQNRSAASSPQRANRRWKPFSDGTHHLKMNNSTSHFVLLNTDITQERTVGCVSLTSENKIAMVINKET